MSNLVDYLGKVVDYIFKTRLIGATYTAYLMREKRFMNDCLDLIDLAVFPCVSRSWIDETRTFVMSTVETGMFMEQKKTFEQRIDEFRSMVYGSGEKLTDIQRETWLALCCLFSGVIYGPSGDPNIENFTEHICMYFRLDEDVVASLLHKHFGDVIDAVSFERN